MRNKLAPFLCTYFCTIYIKYVLIDVYIYFIKLTIKY